MNKKEKVIRPSADKTRHIILKAAERLFAKQGFAATSINEIATRADVNKSLIYHHYESKLGLWRAVKGRVIEQAFQEFGPGGVRHFTEHDHFIDCITQLVSCNVKLFKKNKNFFRMLQWQSLEKKTAGLVGTGSKDPLHEWYDALRRYQDQGELRQDLSVELIFLLIAGVTHSYFDKVYLVSGGISKEDLQILECQYHKVILDMLLMTLTPNNESSRRITSWLQK